MRCSTRVTGRACSRCSFTPGGLLVQLSSYRPKRASSRGLACRLLPAASTRAASARAASAVQLRCACGASARAASSACRFEPCGFTRVRLRPCSLGPCGLAACSFAASAFARTASLCASTFAASILAASILRPRPLRPRSLRPRAVRPRLPCDLSACGLDRVRPPARAASCAYRLLTRAASCPFAAQSSRGLFARAASTCRAASCPCRFLPCCLLPLLLLLGRIGLGQLDGRSDASWSIRARCIAGISKRRHRGLRNRGAWRCRDDGRWHRWSGGHDPRGLVGRRHGDHGRRGDRRGAVSPGRSARKGVCAGAAPVAASVAGLASASDWPPARSLLQSAAGSAHGTRMASALAHWQQAARPMPAATAPRPA